MDILPQLLVNALIAGSIYALASSGLALSYGLLRVLNFAHGHLMMAGAYIFYYWNVDNSHGIFASGLLTVVCVTILGALAYQIFVYPFRRLNYLLTFVTTLSLAIVLEALVSIIFGVNVKSLSAGSLAESFNIGSVYITPIQVVIISSSASLLLVLALIIHRTGLGRKIRALSENNLAAESLSINSELVAFLVFVLSCLLAAYSGVLIGFETNMQPTMGNAYTLKAFACMILGGLGNVWGTVLGSYIFALIENLSIGLDFGNYSLPAGYKDAFAFLIILLVLLFKPNGLFSPKARAV